MAEPMRDSEGYPLFPTTPEGKPYVRVKFKAAGQRPRWHWALQLGEKCFERVRRNGDPAVADKEKDGTITTTRDLLIGEPIEVRKAAMSAKYTELVELEKLEKA